MAIVNRIRTLRIDRDNVSQAQLAKEIGISRQTLHAIECGQRLPSLEVAHRIAGALDRSLDDVFHYESEFPVEDDDDGQLTVTFSFCDGTDWWESDDVSRVTTRA